MDDKRLRKLPLNGENGVEAGHGLLENDRNIVAANLIHLTKGEFSEINTIKENLTASNITIAVKQAQDTHSRYTLTRARFSYDTQGLPFLNGVGNIVYGLYGAALCIKEGIQIDDLKQFFLVIHDIPSLSFIRFRIQCVA